MSGISFLDVLASSPLLINTLIIRGALCPFMGRGMKLKKKGKERGKIKNSYCSKSISFEIQQGNTQNHETSCLLRS